MTATLLDERELAGGVTFRRVKLSFGPEGKLSMEAALFVPKGDGPFATMARAQRAVRGLRRKGELPAPVRVVLRGGIYELDKPWKLGPEDSLTLHLFHDEDVEVYVNGQLVRKESLAPGSYDLLNLPLTTGEGGYQTVLRDAFGRVPTRSRPRRKRRRRAGCRCARHARARPSRS